MKFGIRTPSIKKRLSARTSVKRVIRHSAGIKAPRGGGLVTNPKKGIYNRVYNRTTKDACSSVLVLFILSIGGIVFLITRL